MLLGGTGILLGAASSFLEEATLRTRSNYQNTASLQPLALLFDCSNINLTGARILNKKIKKNLALL